MMWLFGQMFVLCLVSFVAGAAITAVVFVMRPSLFARAAAEPAPEPTGERKLVEMEAE
ncbi:hypothetical protein [Kutzneria sp. CA-103260]|uniref:hypothetical protein n=1 Tax=Kutzneria sp. CA-103260 TaxID=2802641 RepID=UPI001BADD57E|nr:hypothetical protein [Kutzneria sp. CA-103260]QUQ71582.1 hypothetical protein JJ691_93690 [Kutzneria sp. CA-103260]